MACNYWRPCLAGAALLWMSATAPAQDSQDSQGSKESQDKAVARVEVKGAAAEREEKSYRDMLAAVAVFERNRAPYLTVKLMRRHQKR